MFSLIITTLSIALVAALALATLYYGGSAYNEGRAAAQASALIAESQQLLGAAELFYANNQRWPASVQEMVSQKYLRVSELSNGVVSNSHAANSWSTVAPEKPVFVTTISAVDACRKLNQKAYGLDGVLAKARTYLTYQCIGEGSGTLQVIASRSTEQLLSAVSETTSLVGADLVTEESIPAADDTFAWSVPPGTLAAAEAVPESPVVSGAPALEVSFASLTFDRVATNTSEVRTFVLTNTGDALLNLTDGEFAGDAAYSQESSTCAETLAPAANCSVAVRFAPTVVGQATGTYSFATDAPGSPHQIALSADAYNPVELAAGTLPEAMLNVPYAPFDFKTLLTVSNEDAPDKEQATWSQPSGLPSGMSFNDTTGVLQGTPTALTSGSGASFEVVATYKTNSGQQAYTITVGKAVLQVTSISAGSTHTCAVTTSGAAKCWGNNAQGEVGDGTVVKRVTPTNVLGLSTNVTSVVAGSQFSCALDGGGVKCWGLNSFGQLGDNSKTQRRTPVAVSGLGSGVTSISVSAMGGHACAITTGGAVKCWGRNDYGQLGVTASPNSQVPVDVVGLSSSSLSISAGTDHTCATTSSGGAECWGRNTNGQLGDGNSFVSSSPPVAVNGLSGVVTKISAGGSHTCAVVSNSAKCWGANNYGQLGDGTSTSRLLPKNVNGMLSGVSSIATGATHTCAVVSGMAKCWGENVLSEIGDGTAIKRTAPTTVSGLGSGVTSISAGGNLTCAVVSGGAQCWGANDSGQVGDGTSGFGLTRSTPQAVSN